LLGFQIFFFSFLPDCWISLVYLKFVLSIYNPMLVSIIFTGIWRGC
jgi:hypothetical protein